MGADVQGGGPDLGIEVELDPRVNYAMQQNDVPVVKRLRLENLSGGLLQDVVVRVRSEPSFSEPWEARIESIPAGASHGFEFVPLALSPDRLLNQVEREKALLHVEVSAAGGAEARRSIPVELLAYNEWNGAGSLPEILAAFVLPNHPALAPLLSRAGELLEERTGNRGLTGYQSGDPERVRATAAALFEAVLERRIAYVEPPASFEETGQKIRTPDQVLETRLGTCLDLSSLYAALLEEAGLHALVVILRGHAFVGVWLAEASFPEPAILEPLALRKRVDLDALLLVEATLLASAGVPRFEDAVREGRRHLDAPERFLFAIDLKAARRVRIRPLPVRVSGAFRSVEAPEDPPERPGPASAPRPAEPGPATAAPAPAETPRARVQRWKRRLLDLTLRNRLLNFRETQATIPLLCPDIAAFEDSLADGRSYVVHPRPTLMEEGDPRNAAAHRARTGEDALRAFLMEEIRERRLRTGLGGEELNRRLVGIFRAARTSLEESGANTLYLALGFLQWYEAEQSQQPRRAPLILLPLHIERQSMRQGFRVTLAQDETRVNVSLLQKLADDFGVAVEGVEPPPEDEHGLDIAAILRSFRAAVVNIPRWDVVEEAAIGFFSFTKFLMWNDLEERTAELMENDLVRHLVETPDGAFEAGAEFPDPAALDDERRPSETYCLLDADASQLAAVFAAADGRSFVLEGPPGTGKSQTITNLVSHCLALGKRVLFVAEKQAALNVVYDRLCRVGLGPFCLELHSSKANKKKVMEQLQAALATAGVQGTGEWEGRAERLEGLRRELNGYSRALHRPRETGETVFRATSRLVGLRDAPRIDLGSGFPRPRTPQEVGSLRESAQRLEAMGRDLGSLESHPWRAVRRAEWEPSVSSEAEAKAAALGGEAVGLREALEALSRDLPRVDGEASRSHLDLLGAGLRDLLDSPGPTEALLEAPGWDAVAGTLREVLARGRRRDALRSALLERYEPALLGLDLDALHGRLSRGLEAWPPLSWWSVLGVRRAVKAAAREGRVPPSARVLEDLAAARELRGLDAALKDPGSEAARLLGHHWRDGEADWDALEGLLEWTGRFRTFLLRVTAGASDPGADRKRWGRVAAEGREVLGAGMPLGDGIRGALERFGRWEERRAALAAFLELDEAGAWGPADSTGFLGRMEAVCSAWTGNGGALRGWCAWQRARRAAVGVGLEPLVRACEEGRIPAARLSEAFERSFLQWWTETVLHEEPVLRDFFSADHEERIRRFRELDVEVLDLARQVVAARLAARVPQARPGGAPDSSEVGVLLREAKRQRGHMPLRKFIGRVPHLLPMLKPCLLMSPLSVAQFLDPSFQKVDLVVFDEASQIPVWDAVGAIARGRQVVVVGDSKQLPPTAFFERVGEEEAVEEDGAGVEELESVLDDCVASRVPRLHLDWHYRSRHESLISFSNRQYYENRLHTFPSSVKESARVGVALVRVTGTYDRGRSATNRVEAEAVVAEVLRRLRDPDERHRSIGVVTFSQVQQTLIEDLLEEARRGDPSVDAWFGDGVPEPVFIKNLENVQGDERDVILFSVCYGPDAAGGMTMNFGPLNKVGGERRLNVAVTRAREQMVVFSSIGPDAIDLSRTNAKGVADLKTFLDYAARGVPALLSASAPVAGGDFESPFERGVGLALEGRGWLVDRQVGCSGFRIDLAVRNPASPGEYLLGIECDGATYHSARTARDRDRLREAVLVRLGWTLHRIWSTDWWYEPERILDALDRRLRELAEEAGHRKGDPIPLGGTNPVACAPPEEGVEEEEPLTRQPAAPELIRGVVAAPPPAATELSCQADYRSAPPGAVLGNPEAFYEGRSTAAIAGELLALVAVEAPLHADRAARKVAARWGIERVTARVRRRLDAVVQGACPGIQVWGEFLWSREAPPSSYRGFRVPTTDADSSRSAVEIPPEEVANAAAALLPRLVSLPLQDLVRELARLFGFQRMGRRVEDRMAEGVELLRARGGCQVREGVISLAVR